MAHSLRTFVAVTVPLLVALSACSDDSGENAGAAGTASVDDSMSDSSPDTSGTLVEASEPASTGASTTSTTMPAAGPEGGAADGCGAEAEDVTFEQPVPSEASPEMTAAIELARAQPAFDPAAVGPEAIDAVIAEQRRLFDLTGQLVPVESDVVVTAISDAPVPARWFVAPGVDEQRVVVYVHGGGLVAGSAESHGGVAARLSAAARARVLFVEYQRAPEAAFPSQVDQVVAAYRWLLDHDIDPSCVSIAGDSVGGVAVLSATVALRGLGVPLPAGLALLSPVTDQTNSGPSRRTNAATDPVVTGELTGVLTLLSLQGFDAASPVASPLFADLTGLPPMAIWVSASEVLVDDSRRLAEAGRAAGVDVTVREYPGAIHVWPQAAPDTPESAQTIDEMGGWIAAATAR
jgi:epsilon-lactone hydrolase